MQIYDYVDEHGYSPITYAISHGHFNSAINLLKNGADVNFKDGFNITPLVALLLNYNKYVYYDIDNINFLLECGADVNILCEYDDIKWTPINYALKIDHKDNYQIIKLLLLNDATTDFKYFDQNMIHFFKNHYPNKIKIINLLLDYGFDYQKVYTTYEYRGDYFSDDDGFVIVKKTIIDFLSSEEKPMISKTIQSIELSKHCKKIININIPIESGKMMFKPDGFAFKLLSIKYNLINGEIMNIINFKNLELFEYFGIYDIPSLITKITDSIKYIY
ncbi:putative ankyrin repeat protein [Powai lake megavirus]|uniref:Putative ankyrin repeat protein n=1 Tax=Powai lake megavirus TaxID=1842663 RepID=A0A167R3Q8_9VIRU|nr:putative ankyrin repeat protein [Powai lake megavirus]ANB50278.1 putative ankyrin repeat protein [Powai lake megavirus]